MLARSLMVDGGFSLENGEPAARRSRTTFRAAASRLVQNHHLEIMISVAEQDGMVVRKFPVSTSKFGLEGQLWQQKAALNSKGRGRLSWSTRWRTIEGEQRRNGRKILSSRIALPASKRARVACSISN
jgi:hypothetical protein